MKVMVEVEIPDGAILGPLFLVTYGIYTLEEEGEHAGMARMVFHSSCRYRQDHPLAEKIGDKAEVKQMWFQSGQRAFVAARNSVES